jgi:hypothetical protein
MRGVAKPNQPKIDPIVDTMSTTTFLHVHTRSWYHGYTFTHAVADLKTRFKRPYFGHLANNYRSYGTLNKLAGMTYRVGRHARRRRAQAQRPP